MLKFDFNLLWTVINLIIFFLLMRLFLFKPIKKTLAAREEMLKNKFQQADNTVNEANQKLAEYEEHIANVDEEAKQIVIDAKNKAKSEYDKIIKKANDDVSNMKETAKKQIAAENEHAMHNSKEEIARLAMEVAQKVIEDKAGEELDSEIYNKFLNESSESDDK